MILSPTGSSSHARPFLLPFAVLPGKGLSVIRALLCSFILTAIGGIAPFAHAQRVELSVDLSNPGAKIDRNIFGQFAEHLGHGISDGIWVGPDSTIPNTRGIRNDVVTALKAIRVPNVRWPGGCFADEYHWRNGIGNPRTVTLNPNWGGVIEPNTFGTHEFMDFLESDWSGGLRFRERRLRHSTGSSRMARISDHRSADNSGQRARSQRSSRSLQSRAFWASATKAGTAAAT